MSTGSSIEWTESTWNPVVGCTRASAGCDHCYAVTMTHRLEAMGQEKYAGLTVLNNRGDRHFNGTVRTVPEALAIPLKWRKPRRVFVNSMSDLFHKSVPFAFVDRVFAVMALCPQHTFQVLTKRPDRMAEYTSHPGTPLGINKAAGGTIYEEPLRFAWPLPNVWLGTSCEDQRAADARIPHLLRCPAAVRFLSCEPLIGPVDIWQPIRDMKLRDTEPDPGGDGRFLHWVIVGGESGPGARRCDASWVLSIIEQCKAVGVACFVKQLGAKPYGLANPLSDSKGGDMTEWPKPLQVREFPR